MKNQSVTAHPLCWPDGWPRTPAHQRQDDNVFSTKRSSFTPAGGGWNPLTFDRARRLLADELERLRGADVVLSSNVPLRMDGQPSGGAGDRRYADPGIACYFTYKGKPMVMANDRYKSTAGNMRSLSLAIEAMRTLERHGGGTMMEKAFSGFTALPAPDGAKPKRPWWTVMNYSPDPAERLDLSVEEVEARFKTLAKRRHPDVDGGSADAFSELSEARDEAVRAVGG